MSCETLDRDTLLCLQHGSSISLNPATQACGITAACFSHRAACRETVKSRSSSSLVFKVQPLDLTPESVTQTRLYLLALPPGPAWSRRCKGKTSNVTRVRHKGYRVLNLLRRFGGAILTRTVHSKASFSLRCSAFYPAHRGEQSQPCEPARQLAPCPRYVSCEQWEI